MCLELNKFESENIQKKILVYDVPLIFETKSQKKYDLILLAHCDKKVQRERVLARDKISNSLFENLYVFKFDKEKYASP